MSLADVVSAENLTEICVGLDRKINSRGVWNEKEDPLRSYGLSVLMLQLFVSYALSEGVHCICRPIGLPRLVSQMLTGFALSRMILGRFRELHEYVFTPESIEVIRIIGILGYTLFLFLAGVKINVSIMFQTGKKAFFIGSLSVLIPLIVGSITQEVVSKRFHFSDTDQYGLGLITATQAATSFAVIADFLQELKIINSEIGRLGVSCALAGDIFSIVLRFAMILSKIFKKSSSSDEALLKVFVTFALVIVLVYVVRPVLFWVIRQTIEGKPVKQTYVYNIFISVLVTGLIANFSVQFIPLGPFFFGLIIPDGPPLGSAFVQKLDCFNSGVWLPFYAITSVMKSDLQITHLNMVKASQIIFVVIFVTKMAASLVPPLCCKMPLRDSLLIALIMTCKGVVDLGTYMFMLDVEHKITPDVFTGMMFNLIFNVILVQILVKYLYDPARKYIGYQKRSIMHSQSGGLQILACIYQTHNIPSMITFLNASQSTKEHQNSVNVLHVEELTGRASPIFISHQLQKKNELVRSCSRNVILSFDLFQQMHPETVRVNTFTAISPLDAMHEDICNLAMRKQTSLILLPFHMKWAVDGSIESEDGARRALNCSVLERAPSSVGILIDRSHKMLGKSTYRVCMIFIGGKDDREALALATRMAKDPKIHLTVMRLISSDDNGELDWDKMLDHEELKCLKQTNTDQEGELTYVEEVVEDGCGTSTLIHTLINNHDIFIVGRRQDSESPQTQGLAVWSEFSELGVLGDLLASRDLAMNAMVLVIQQQMTG